MLVFVRFLSSVLSQHHRENTLMKRCVLLYHVVYVMNVLQREIHLSVIYSINMEIYFLCETWHQLLQTDHISICDCVHATPILPTSSTKKFYASHRCCEYSSHVGGTYVVNSRNIWNKHLNIYFNAFFYEIHWLSSLFSMFRYNCHSGRWLTEDGFVFFKKENNASPGSSI